MVASRRAADVRTRDERYAYNDDGRYAEPRRYDRVLMKLSKQDLPFCSHHKINAKRGQLFRRELLLILRSARHREEPRILF